MEKVNCTSCGMENPTNSKYCSRCGYELPKIKTEIVNEPVQQQVKKTNEKSKKIVGIVAGVIAFGLTYYGVQQLFLKPPSIDKVMMQAASELNKTCPIMIDPYTRLDNAIAMPDNSFQYNYTMVNVGKSEVNIDTIKKSNEPRIINNVKTDPNLKIYRDNKTTMIYNYLDKNGVFVFKISVTADMYQ